MKGILPLRKNATWLLMLLACLCCQLLTAGNLVDTLQARRVDYNRENPLINLYVHLDRNIYAPEDTVWLKAYVLTPYLNEVLYVRLVDKDKELVLEKQFPMYDIRAHGDFQLPAALPEGTYYLYAYTDRMISFNPGDVFVQPISVRKINAQLLAAEASVVNNKRVMRGDKVEILTRVSGPDGRLLKGTFSLWARGGVFKKGGFTTNNQGEATFDFNYPQLDSTEMVRCEIAFVNGKVEASLTLNIRHEGNTPKINAYAEGGHFIEGLPVQTVFKVFDDYKNPLEAQVALLEDNRIITQTQTNRWGMGTVVFTPCSEAAYTVAIQENGTTINLPFPGTIEKAGIGLRLDASQGGVKAVLTNNDAKDTATLVLSAMDKVLWSQVVPLRPGDSTSVPLPVADYEKGILELAVFDSIAAPKAERLFLNRVAEAYKVRCSTTRSFTRGVMTLNVNLDVMDAQNNPVAANVSVAIVEQSLLNKKTYRSIQDAYYLKGLMGAGPGLLEEPEALLDNHCVTFNRGLKRWDNVLRYDPKGFVRLLENTGGVYGQVTSKNDKPVSLKQLTLESSTAFEKKGLVALGSLLAGGPQPLNQTRQGRITYTFKDWMDVVSVDEAGRFSISPKTLLVQPNETKYIMPGLDFSTQYTLQLNDFAEEMDAFVRMGDALNIPQPVNTFTKYVPPTINRMDKTIQLREVTVDSKSRYSLREEMGKKDDYVCREFNVFNCVNHRTSGYKPVAGMVYNRNDNGGPFLYNGVGKPYSPAPDGYPPGSIYYALLKGISVPNSFYTPTANDTSFFKLDTRVTVFWSPNLYIDASGHTTFDCLLSERSGVYTLVVQGLEVKTRRPIYGTFDVRF